MKTKDKFTVLLIDDSAEILDTLSALLRPDYSVLAARSGLAGLDIASRLPQPHLILLDVMMPDLDGYAVLARLKENPLTRDIPVVLLTSLNDPASEEYGFEMGAADYISKPLIPNVLKARVRNQLEARQAREWLKVQNEQLQTDIVQVEAEKELLEFAAIRALATLAGLRDDKQGLHVVRVQNFVWLLAELLRDHPRFKDTLTPGYIDLLVVSTPLHDIGKVGIPDHILLKGEAHDEEERAILQTHAQLGFEAIDKVERELARPVPFLAHSKEITRWHHEEWAGGGYPDGLVAEAIPVSARLVALADAFDVLISHHANKAPMALEEARDKIAEGRNVRFDPDITDAFLENFDEFVEIVEKYPEIAQNALTVMAAV
jgi:putative two-component system response regulator